MDSSALDSLVKWANTFEGLSKPCESLTDLSDGVILNDILAQMAPKYFSADGIKKDVEDNFVLKTNNIKKIVANLDKLYQVELGIHDNINIDSAAIGKEQSIPEIVKLVELVLGVLVESEHKAEYLQKIMHLDEVTQRELMVVLEGIINKHQVEMSADHSFHDSSSIAFEDARLVEMQNHIEQLTRELYEEKEQLSDLKQEHAMALEQIKTLRDEREAMQKAVYSLEDALKEEQERAKKEKESFVATIPRQSSQNALAEETTLVFTTQIEERDKTISDLKKKIEELAKQAAEARTLRDELDIMREKVLLTSGLEEKLKKAQQKSEQVADLKKQIKTLEEQNDLYLKKTLDAEDAASKANQFKSHLESYKQQLSTLKAEHTQLEVTLRTQQSDYERMKTDYNNVMLENQALKFRVESLQSEVDDLINSKHGSSMDETIGSLGDEFAPQVKERLAILERENKRLKEGLQIEVEHRVSELTHQLEDANRLNEVLKKELEKGGGGIPSAASQQEIDMLKDQLAKLNEENSRNLAEINNLLKDKQEYIQYKANNEHLTEKIKAAAEKIAALSAEKTKHEGFLRAAKSIIQEQREQLKQLKDQNAEASKKELEDAVQSYKTQLKEKDQQIEMIKKLWEEGKENSAREQRLMTSAFYDMGLELHRLRTLKSSSSSTPTSPSPSTSSTNLLGSFTPSSTPRSLLANLRQNRE